ncbi:hypothetical protein PUR59_16545 [Streptomyces sp. SP18ES09]|uniref:hypothetical protein n=1 Tax=Streptomyces sp. SP18ES09 TaxID=3002532 RepID=UPI002E779A9A|nr:hypothetical protein [Streptomyces sp. SP18ES09]MEE1816617.1 hypothetical protein [Streptomyces sp. SP18ES09]
MSGAPTTSAPDPAASASSVSDPAASASSVPDPDASGSVPDADADAPESVPDPAAPGSAPDAAAPGSAPDAAGERERKARERKARKASSDEAPPGLTVLMVLFFGWETLSDDNAVWMRILAALLLIAGVTELVRIVRRRRRARR